MSSRKRKWSLGLLGVSLLAVAAVASAQSAKARYPYDPACAWGRVANGKGMLVRCLSEQEAVALAKGTAPVPAKAEPDAATQPAAEDAPAPEVKSGPLTVEVGPITAPVTVVFAHGWCLRMGAFHFQRARLEQEWALLERGPHSVAQLRDAVVGEFQVDAPTAHADLLELMHTLLARGLVELRAAD